MPTDVQLTDSVILLLWEASIGEKCRRVTLDGSWVSDQSKEVETLCVCVYVRVHMNICLWYECSIAYTKKGRSRQISGIGVTG